MHQVSIETAQSGLDCSVLKILPGKAIILDTAAMVLMLGLSPIKVLV